MTNRIVVDPGHGGTQSCGRSSPEGAFLGSGQCEREINYDLAQRLLHHVGGARLTRGGAENKSLSDRILMARDQAANVFVSLHSNPDPDGTGVWVHSRANGASQRLADSIRHQLGSNFGGASQVLRGDLAVINPDAHHSTTAACLVELGSRDAVNLDRAAAAIARGMQGYLGQPSPTSPRRLYFGPDVDGGASNPSASDENKVRFDPSRAYLEIVDDNTAAVPPPAPSAAAAGYDRAMEGNAVDTIVNTGKALWDVMKDNRPVANVTVDTANALPKDVDFQLITGWQQEPRTLRLHFHSSDILNLGVNDTDIYLTVSWFFNGSYAGAGQFINRATVIATGSVAFGNTVNVTVSIGSPMNFGTSQAAIAALPIRISLTESNVFQSHTFGYDGVLQGNGAGKIAGIP